MLFAVPPKFVSRNFKDKIFLQVGTSSALKVHYFGSPRPTAELSFNGRPFPDDKLDISATVVSITLHDIDRSDSGVYTVDLHNVLGRDKIDIEVVVIGKIYQSVR